MNVRPVTLEGRYVRLEPLGPQHVDALIEVAAWKGIFRYFPIQIDTADEVRRYLDYCQAAMSSRQGVTFATVSIADERPVGITSFLAIDEANRRLEIGGTWIAPDWQRTAFNTEAKYLQMRHAFEELAACASSSRPTRSTNARAPHSSASARWKRAHCATT